MARAQTIPGIDPGDTIVSNASLIIPVRVGELVAWERYIRDPDRVYELHQMRIAAKRLRYTMETFAPFYGKEFGAAIDRVKAIQEMLGDIHDADVLVPALQAHLCDVLAQSRKSAAARGVYGGDFDAATGLLALCRRKQADRKAIYRRFLTEWRALKSARFFETLREVVRSAEEKPAKRKAAKANGAAAEPTPPTVTEGGLP